MILIILVRKYQKTNIAHDLNNDFIKLDQEFIRFIKND